MFLKYIFFIKYYLIESNTNWITQNSYPHKYFLYITYLKSPNLNPIRNCIGLDINKLYSN